MATWRKSSWSTGGSGNECVEVAPDLGPGVVGVRDSKVDHSRPGSPQLAVDAGGFAGFLEDVKAGRFDRS